MVKSFPINKAWNRTLNRAGPAGLLGRWLHQTRHSVSAHPTFTKRVDIDETITVFIQIVECNKEKEYRSWCQHLKKWATLVGRLLHLPLSEVFHGL